MIKFCLLFSLVIFAIVINAEHSNGEGTIDGSNPGQGIPSLLVNLFPAIEEESTTKKPKPYRRRYFSNDVRIPPAFQHLYPEVVPLIARVKRNLNTINFDEYVPSPLTDFYGLRTQSDRLVQETTTEDVDITTEIITTSTTTTRRPRRPMQTGRRRRPMDPAARARARQRLANRDQRIPPGYAHLYPSPENRTLNGMERPRNRTRHRPDFPSRIPPAFQHLYPEPQTPSPGTPEVENTTTKKPRRRPDFPSRIPPAYQHLYPDPPATTTILSPTESEAPARTLSRADTSYVSLQTTNDPNQELNSTTTSIDTTPFLSSRAGFTSDETIETTTPRQHSQINLFDQQILNNIQNKVNNLIQSTEDQKNKQLSIEQRIIGIENILKSKYELVQIKINDILKQIVRLESQNNRLDSGMYGLRKNSVIIKHSIDSLVNTSAVIPKEISKNLDLVLRIVEDLRNDIKQASTLQFKRSTIINTEGDDLSYYAIEAQDNSLPKSCLENQNYGFNKPGVYRIYPLQSTLSFFVFCDSGWTVIQNRKDTKMNFTRTWDDYKLGFGNLEENFWLGLEKIHILTNYDKVELMIELEDQNSVKTYAHYYSFAVGSEFEGYPLYLLGTYNGNAGDYLRPQVGQKFTTFDTDLNDKCSGGWWTKDECGKSNLNGQFTDGSSEHFENGGQGIYWNNGEGQTYKTVRMLIRTSKQK